VSQAQETQDARAAWDKIAPGYDKTITPTHMWLGNESLRRLGLRGGMRFLDVAAGSGALSIPAARLGAQVLATDLSPDTRVAPGPRTPGGAQHRDPGHGWPCARARRQQLRPSRIAVRRHVVSRHAEGNPRDGARCQAGRPCAGECICRPAQDRVSELLGGCGSVCPSRLPV
jgi:hypothetical protein